MSNDGLANRKYPNTGGWQDRHDNAWKAVDNIVMVSRVTDAAINMQRERSLVAMFRGWKAYAATHKAQFEDPIAHDYILGPQWLAIGKSLRALLNGETGRLDCGTVDAFIIDTLAENGFSEQDL